MTVKSVSVNPRGPAEIESRVAPMLVHPLPSGCYDLLAQYVDLFYRWNRRISLSAVRDPEVLIDLHLAECLRAAQRIPKHVESVLDFGSGAGLPGIPIQIARPDLRVTLGESQKKKAAFLREVVRELRLSRATVYPGRVENLPDAYSFDLVALRAVDKMTDALKSALPRVHSPRSGQKGWCMILTSLPEVEQICDLLSAIDWLPPEPVPTTNQRILLLGYRSR